jgi:hypothetical protein
LVSAVCNFKYNAIMLIILCQYADKIFLLAT